jgi:hypothetical protein
MSTREAAIGIDPGRFWSSVMRSGLIGPGKAGGLRRQRLGVAHRDILRAEHAELDYTSPRVSVLLHAVLARANR